MQLRTIPVNTPFAALFRLGLVFLYSCTVGTGIASAATDMPVLKAGDSSLKEWILPDAPASPADNKWTRERAELGKMLFFDPRLSGTGQVTCASCHFPERGWADGLPTAVRFQGTQMPLASPHIVNIAYNTIFMWDGRMPTLEKQAFGGQGEKADINAGSKVKTEDVVRRIAGVKGYAAAFDSAYPGEGVTRESIAKAIASFERTVLSKDSPFDRWLKGDADAMTSQQINGFRVFLDPKKGACANCHQAPNFTDNGFHNIGLKSYGAKNHHPGRGKQKPIKIMDGAFKTPGLRDVALTSPYFHDGSAATLRDVVEHYARGGEVKTNLSPNFKKAVLSDSEKADLVAFLEALTTPPQAFVYPVLPKE